MAQNSLYERLGGAFAIAAVVDRFSDAIINDKIAGSGSDNPALREWHTKELGRLPGLKFMRTLWLCNVAGGPQGYVGTRPGHDRLSLEEAHRDLHINAEEFDEVAGSSRRRSTSSTFRQRRRAKYSRRSRPTREKSRKARASLPLDA